MIDKNIQHLVKREAAAIKPTIDAHTLFISNEFQGHLKDLIDVVTEQYSVPIKLRLLHDPLNEITAYTDGREITQNTHNELVFSFENLYNRYMACVGMTMHEVSHILFCNFGESKKAIDVIETGALYGEAPDVDSQEDLDALDEMLDALKIPEYRPIFANLYSQLDNCISDPHDEDKLIERFGGFVENTILMTRESLRMSIVSLEDMMKDDKYQPLSIIFSLVLQFVRFGEIVADDPDAMYSLEPVQKLMQISTALEEARYTDDPVKKFSQINRVLLYLWPYIKEEIDKLEPPQQKQDGDSDEQENDGNGDPQQGSGNGNGQQQSGGGQQQQPSNGQPQQQPGSGQQNAPSQQTVQAVLNQLQQGSQNSGQTAAPQNGKTSAIAKQISREAKKGQQEQAAAGKAAAPSQGNDAMSQNKFDALMDALSQAMAEENVQQNISNAVGSEIRAINQNSTHRGRSVKVVPQIHTTDEDKKLYDSLMADLKGYSKLLQRRMLDALRDLKDGSVAHHRSFGNVFEAREAYRPDQKYYAQKKLPQDLPDMAISILVDHSGSMAGERLQASMKASMLLYDFATNLGIPVCVSGHNTTMKGINYYTYTDYQKVSNSEKYRLAKMVSGSCNRDGMALEIAANQLAKRPEEVKLLIIISDGQPNDTGYGGESAAKDIQSIVRKYRKQGVETIAAAIGSDKEHIKDIYGEGAFLDITDLDKFPKTLTALVKKRIIP